MTHFLQAPWSYALEVVAQFASFYLGMWWQRRRTRRQWQLNAGNRFKRAMHVYRESSKAQH